MRYEGVDALGHVYLRDAEPERFGDVRRAAARRSVLDRYYAFLDAEIGRAVDRLGSGDLLLVVSGFGIEPAPLLKRALGRMLGDPPVIPIDTRPGTHEQAPDGFLLAYGDHVADGELRRGSIVDVTPTVLYYMGLPIGRDMDGFARTDLFRSTFTREHPVLYTATHER
jgi:predicted AlkP superfamily phosphohydrolase/phosphomutase